VRGEEVPIDGDIVINFSERTKSRQKIVNLSISFPTPEKFPGVI
jgi:hypothetical protein